MPPAGPPGPAEATAGLDGVEAAALREAMPPRMGRAMVCVCGGVKNDESRRERSHEANRLANDRKEEERRRKTDRWGKRRETEVLRQRKNKSTHTQ